MRTSRLPASALAALCPIGLGRTFGALGGIKLLPLGLEHRQDLVNGAEVIGAYQKIAGRRREHLFQGSDALNNLCKFFGDWFRCAGRTSREIQRSTLRTPAHTVWF